MVVVEGGGGRNKKAESWLVLAATAQARQLTGFLPPDANHKHTATTNTTNTLLKPLLTHKADQVLVGQRRAALAQLQDLLVKRRAGVGLHGRRGVG